MHALRSVSLIFICLILAACNKRTIVGSWETTSDVNGMKANQTMTFEDDKGVTVNFKASGGKPPFDKMSLTINGKYETDGKTLTITPDTMKVDGLPDQLKAMAEQSFNAQKKPQSGKFDWKSDDEFTFTPDEGQGKGMTATFKRKKA